MKRRELKERTSTPSNPKRTLAVLNDIPYDGLIGGAGHHDYTEEDVRLMEAWSRVMDLTGGMNGEGADLRRRAARLLASATSGYVWISGGRVGWSPEPPLNSMKLGATVWPAAIELD